MQEKGVLPEATQKWRQEVRESGRVNSNSRAGHSRGRVEQVLEPWDGLVQPGGHKLKVAVPNGVEEVKAQPVDVKGGDGGATQQPRAEHGDRKDGCVENVLREWVHRPCADKREGAHQYTERGSEGGRERGSEGGREGSSKYLTCLEQTESWCNEQRGRGEMTDL